MIMLILLAFLFWHELIKCNYMNLFRAGRLFFFFFLSGCDLGVMVLPVTPEFERWSSRPASDIS